MWRITLSFLYTICGFSVHFLFLLLLYVMFECALCMCLLVLSSLSLSGIISSSSSGIAGNHHAAAAAGAGCSITGDPYHGKHLKPLEMAPILRLKVSLEHKGTFLGLYVLPIEELHFKEQYNSKNISVWVLCGVNGSRCMVIQCYCLMVGLQLKSYNRENWKTNSSLVSLGLS